jgi:excisionase family DNA binding protein
MALEMAQVSDRLLYSRQRAADLLDLSPRTIDGAIRSGAIETRRVGRRVLISREALIRFIENQEAMGCAK